MGEKKQKQKQKRIKEKIPGTEERNRAKKTNANLANRLKIEIKFSPDQIEDTASPAGNNKLRKTQYTINWVGVMELRVCNTNWQRFYEANIWFFIAYH